MKEILAVIRMNKMNATKKALSEIGIASMTARKVIGRGKGKVDYMLLKGAEEGYDEAINQLSPGPKLIPKRMLTIVTRDEKVDEIVKTIIEVNQTKSPGDGKIFVMPIMDVVRVRTEETGIEALGDLIDEK